MTKFQKTLSLSHEDFVGARAERIAGRAKNDLRSLLLEKEQKVEDLKSELAEKNDVGITNALDLTAANASFNSKAWAVTIVSIKKELADAQKEYEQTLDLYKEWFGEDGLAADGSVAPAASTEED